MKEAGYDVIFWCGKPSEAAMQDASVRMASAGNAIMPKGALPLPNPACAGAFDVNLLRKTVRAAGVGFSLYSKGAEMGHAVTLPDGFGGDFGG